MKLVKHFLRKHTTTAWAEDTAPQAILLMGLPAAGKSTFIVKELSKHYNQKLPHGNAYQEVNSDRHLVKYQHEKAQEDFDRLKHVDEKMWDAETRVMTYRSNDGNLIPFKLSFEEFQKIPNIVAFKKVMFKPYYATFFGRRSDAKLDTDALMDKKLKSADVLIMDSTGTNYTKMLAFFEKAKSKGFTTSVVFLDLPVETAIARDLERGRRFGRTVTSSVILSYVPELAPALAMYKNSDLVDRVMHFVWKKSGSLGIYDGAYVLKNEIKKYPKNRA